MTDQDVQELVNRLRKKQLTSGSFLFQLDAITKCIL